MITRARTTMLIVYALLLLAGIVFLTAPMDDIEPVLVYKSLTKVWGCFFTVGGIVAGVSLGVRTARTNLLAMWYFEIAGLSLLVAATAVYAFALFDAAFQYNNLQIGGIGVVVLSFAASLSIRVAEAIEIVQRLKIYIESSGGGGSDRA